MDYGNNTENENNERRELENNARSQAWNCFKLLAKYSVTSTNPTSERGEYSKGRPDAKQEQIIQNHKCQTPKVTL